jgi:PAS domain S-box-containing protein
MSHPVLRVLLVDDSEDDYFITQRVLGGARFEKFTLDWTPHYEAGLEAIRARSHDAYLVDYRLRDRTGLDLVREVARSRLVAPVILLTGVGDDGLQLDALLAGSADYLDKTQLDSPLLERTIRHAVDRSHYFEQLRRSEERFRVLVENLSDGITMLARDGTLLYASRSTSDILGYKVEEMVGHKLFTFIHPEDVASAMRLFSECLAKPGTPVFSEHRYRSKNGGWRHIEAVSINRLHEGAVSAIVATIRDVSARKENEKDLVERERQFRALFDSALDAMVLVGDNRNFLDANPAACHLFALSRDRLLTQLLSRSMP